MQLLIDFRNTDNNDPALRRFTMDLWHDLAVSRPDTGFTWITGKRQSLPPSAANCSTLPLQKWPLAWMDRWQLKKAAERVNAKKLIRLFPGGMDVCAAGTGNVLQRLLFAASEPEASAAAVPIFPVLREYERTVSWASAESIKTQYTGGRIYYLYIGNIDEQQDLIELLKAFSMFKKRQQTSMQLVLAGTQGRWADELEEKLETYKYRSDIVVIASPSDEDLARLAAAAYALVSPSATECFPQGMLWAMHSGKAIIATDNRVNRQISAVASWVLPGNTAAGFATAMMQLYKDEDLLHSLEKQTIDAAAGFNRQQMLSEVWQQISR